MILLVDIGNTRIKWARLEARRMSAQRADTYAEWTHEQLRRRLLEPLDRPTRVLVSNVGGERIASLLASETEALWSTVPMFVRSTAEAVGVRNGYREPSLLGVDRWLAVIGAYHLERRAVCVVSVGTAMTVDAVDASGQHLGGMIVPGPDLMMNALYRNTSDIAAHAQQGGGGSDFFADNTQAAVFQGVSCSLAATVERAVSELQARWGVAPALLITGGATARVSGGVRVPFRLVPDLVLRGLAEIACATEC